MMPRLRFFLLFFFFFFFRPTYARRLLRVFLFCPFRVDFRFAFFFFLRKRPVFLDRFVQVPFLTQAIIFSRPSCHSLPSWLRVLVSGLVCYVPRAALVCLPLIPPSGLSAINRLCPHFLGFSEADFHGTALDSGCNCTGCIPPSTRPDFPV